MISIDSNKYINHWINHKAVFALCVGFGYKIRLGIVVSKFGKKYLTEFQLFYWRIFIGL